MGDANDRRSSQYLRAACTSASAAPGATWGVVASCLVVFRSRRCAATRPEARWPWWRGRAALRSDMIPVDVLFRFFLTCIYSLASPLESAYLILSANQIYEFMKKS